MKKHVVIVTNLYPNLHDKNRGIFIRQLVERLTAEFDITVICPIPWRPNFLVVDKDRIPASDTINGIDVFYPRHIVIPKLLRASYGWLMYQALLPAIKKLHHNKQIDLVSAHWIYPDGVGAVKAAKNMGLPIVVHALGCDINEYSKYLMRRIQISKALKDSNLVVVKSQDLAKKTMQLGANENNLRVIHNGVDREVFYQQNMQSVRLELGLEAEKNYLLFVGNLQQEKGLQYLIDAMSMLSPCECELIIIGGGPLESSIKNLVKAYLLESVVHFYGRIPHNLIPKYINAVNALCLPSIREGCPNIVLESLSCGTPVLASRVGAVPEIITDDAHGIIVSPQSADQLAQQIPNILKIKTEKSIDFNWYGWDKNAESISHVFKEILT